MWESELEDMRASAGRKGAWGRGKTPDELCVPGLIWFG